MRHIRSCVASLFTGGIVIACGARTSLPACGDPDPVTDDPNAIVVPPITIVPRSAAALRLGSGNRAVVVSPAVDVCQELKELKVRERGIGLCCGGLPPVATREAHWLTLGFWDHAERYPVGGKLDGYAGVAHFCPGDEFTGTGSFLFMRQPNWIEANAGFIDVTVYDENQRIAGTYDLTFPNGATVRGSFDALWCNP